MTLYNLVNNTTIQGNVRITAYDDGSYNLPKKGENVLFEEENVDDLCGMQEDYYEDAEIVYMFCDKNGYLNIELDPEDIKEKETEDE